MQAFLALTALVAIAYGQDYSLLEVKVADSLASESLGSIVFTPTLYNKGNLGDFFSTTAAGPAFRYRTLDGTAKAGTDYVAVPNGQFKFASDRHLTSSTVAIKLVNDQIVETSTETFALVIELAAPTAALLNIVLPATNPVGTITDDENLTLELVNARAVEGVNSKFDFKVVLSHEVAVDFPLVLNSIQRVGDMFAQGDVDYEAVEDAPLVFTAGETSKTFSVSIIDDNIQENIETFEVLVQYDPSASESVDFDWPASRSLVGTFAAETEGVTICVADTMMEEGDSEFMKFNVVISHAVDGPVPFSVSTATGSKAGMNKAATVNRHYYDNARSFTFPANSQASHEFRVTIENDDIQSPHAMMTPDASFGPINFGVNFRVASSVWAGGTGDASNAFNVLPCRTTGQTGSAMGEIYDFEDVTVALTSNHVMLVENSTDTFKFTVSLSHQVEGSEMSGSKARGASFSWVDSNVASVYGTSSVQTSQASFSSTTVGGVPVITSGCANEPNFGNKRMPSNGPVDVCWPSDITPLNVGNGRPVVVPTVYTFDAVAGSVIAPEVAEFMMGPSENIIEGDETFKVGIKFDSVTSAGYRIRAADGMAEMDGIISMSATIVDDEPSNPFVVKSSAFNSNPFTASTSLYTVEEFEGSSFSYSVTMSHSAAIDVSMTWSTADGSAIEAADYTKASSSTLNWPAFSKPGSIRTATVDIKNDDVQENIETFTVNFGNIMPAHLANGNDGLMQTAIITDNEGMTISISDMSEAMDESAVNWDFDVALSHAADHDLTVTYAAAFDAGMLKPAAASRFSAASSNLRFPALVKTAVANVIVFNDNVQTGTVNDVEKFAVVVNTMMAPEISTVLNSKTKGVALVSDDEGVVVSVSEGYASENDASVTFQVALSHMVSEPVSVTYTTMDIACAADAVNCAIGSAKNGVAVVGSVDYVSSAVDAAITIPAMTKAANLVVALVNDQVQEYTENFNLDLTSVIAPLASGFMISDTMSTSSATITDDEQTKVSIGAAAANEGAELLFTVKLTHAVSSPVTVKYQLYEGTAKLGSDFKNIADSNNFGSIVVPAMARSAVISILAKDDDVAEKAETFSISLLNTIVDGKMSAVLTGNPFTGIGTIGNADFYDEGLTLTVTAPAAVERGVDAVFDVKLSHKTDHKIFVSFTTSDQTAMAGSDYMAASGSITFPADSSAAQKVIVPTRIAPCQERQVTETFKLALVNPAGFAYGGVVSQIGTIKPFDNKPTIVIADAVSNEGETMEFKLTLSHCVSEAVYVGYNYVTDGTATAFPGKEFMLPATRFVTFPAGPTASLMQNFGVKIVDDQVQGAMKMFTMKVQAANAPLDNAPAFGITFPDDTATGQIEDDEFATITITQCVAQRPSDNEQFLFTVTLSHAVGAVINLDYSTSDLSAVAGLDYEVSSGRVQYTVGTKGNQVVSVKTFNRPGVVQPTGFGGIAPPTRFAMNLNPEDQSVLDTFKVKFGLGDGQTADNIGKGAIMGKANTLVTMPRATGMEGTTQSFTATIQDEVAVDVIVGYTATKSKLFINNANPMYDLRNYVGNFTFKKNMGPMQAATFAIDLYDDFLVEAQETYDVVLTVLSPNGFRGTVINFDAVSQAHVITDNDFATISVMDATAGESNIPGVVSQMEFKVVLSHYVYQEVTVDLNPSSVCLPGRACIVTGAAPPALQSPEADLWYASGSISKVVFPVVPEAANVLNGHTQSVFFKVLNDNVIEPAETFLLTASTTSTVVGQAGSKLTGTGTIVDDEMATYIFSAPKGLEGEVFSFDVSVSHKISGSFTVDYETVAGAGTDLVFVSKKGTISLSASAPTNSFTIQTVDNLIVSPFDVPFKVKTMATTPAVMVVQGVATGLLVDDDEQAYIGVSVENVDENSLNPKLTFFSTLYSGTNTSFNVAYKTMDIAGQAVAGKDYTAVSGTHKYLGLPLEQFAVEVPVINDNLVEKDEMVGFEVTVTSPEYKPLIEVVNKAGKIVDTEEAIATIQDAVVREGAGAEMIFTVFLSHEVDTNTDFKLEYMVFADASATAASSVDRLLATGVQGGKDFDAKTSMLSGAFAGKIALIKVPIHDDHITEVPETLHIEVTKDLSTKLTLKQKQAAGVINDDDAATISISSVDSHSETVSPVVLTVTMSHLSQPDVVVTWQTLDGYASSVRNVAENKNVDFVARNSTITFPSAFKPRESAGVGATPNVQPISIVVINDALVEEAFEDFCVSLREVVEPKMLGVSIFDKLRDGFVVLTDDAEAATITVASVTNEEGSVFNFVATMSHGIQAADVTVAYTTALISGEANSAAQSDFGAKSGKITFAKSVQENAHPAMTSIDVTANTDTLDEFDERFEVVLTSINDNKPIMGFFGNVSLGPKTLSLSSPKAWGIILDKKGDLPLNKLSVQDAVAKEQDGFIDFVVYFPRSTENHLKNNERISFTYFTYSGKGDNAFTGQDYISSEGSGVIEVGKETTTIRVLINDNAIVQGDHKFSINIGSSTPISRFTASGVITDNDKSLITVGDATGAEMVGGTIRFPVTLSKAVDSEILFEYKGNANEADVTRASAAGLVRIAAGVTSTFITIDVANNNVQQADRVFTLDASAIKIANLALRGEVSFGRASATGTITDDEKATVSIVDRNEVMESVGGMRFLVTLSHAITQQNEVEFAIASGSAILGTDFDYRGANTVSFVSRDSVAAPTAVILIDIKNDMVAEKTETFTVEIVKVTTGMYKAATSRATVSIVDDDFATIVIAGVTGKESQGTFDFQVTLSHACDTPVTVLASSFNIQGDTKNPAQGFAAGSTNDAPVVQRNSVGVSAVQPDFQLMSETIPLRFGVVNTVSVTVYDDTEQECDEEFSVRLTNLQCGAAGCGSLVSLVTGTATGKLTQDDEGLTIMADAVMHDESRSLFEFKLTLSHAVDSAFTVTTSVVAEKTAASRLVKCTGSLLECQPFSVETMTILPHLPADKINGATTLKKTITVDVKDDIIAQAPGIFAIKIVTTHNPTCGALTVVNGVGTIQDNEMATIEIMDFSGVEDKAHPMLVQLSHAIEFDLTVGFRVNDDDLEVFEALTGSLTFKPVLFPAKPTAVANVLVKADDKVEPISTYTVEITNSPAWLALAGLATVTIIDDEVMGSLIQCPPVATAEGTTLRFAITPVGDHENPITMMYRTVNGQAAIGLNYNAVQGDLFWAVGDVTPQIVEVTTVARAGVGTDKQMFLELSGVTGGSELSNLQNVMLVAGLIREREGTTVSLTAPAIVTAGTSLVLTPRLSTATDFAVTVPVKLTMGAAVSTQACTIAVGAFSCSITVATTGPTKDFSAVIDATAFPLRNVFFSAAVLSTTAATGTIRVVTAQPTPVPGSQPPAVVARGVACGGLSNTAITRNMVGDSNFPQSLVASACFSGVDLVFTVAKTSGSSTAVVAGANVAFAASAVGVSEFVLTATNDQGSASIAITVAASEVQITQLQILNAGIVVKQGQYFERLVSRVVNDISLGNINECASNGAAPGVTNTDCCFIVGTLKETLCERQPPTGRQVRLESVRISFLASALGTSTVCLGTKAVVGPNFCFDVEVVV